MQDVYYIQRLNAPLDTDNPYAFGGGKINGGIGKEAMDTIRKIWSFDYMGSAEFEYGAVPKALSALSELKLVTRTLTEIKPVYVIAPEAIIEEVCDWVSNAANGNHGRLKEYLGLQETLKGNKYENTLGWLKVENNRICEEPFMFFINRTMFLAACEIFGCTYDEKLVHPIKTQS